MNQENNDDFDFNDWFGDMDMGTSRPLTEDEWNDYAYFPKEDRYTEKDYLIGYYDMGVFNEQIVRACNEELAADGFLCDYQSKRGLPPYIARCETVERAKIRMEVGYTDLPEDGQMWRYADFGNAYYEALNN